MVPEGLFSALILLGLTVAAGMMVVLLVKIGVEAWKPGARVLSGLSIFAATLVGGFGLFVGFCGVLELVAFLTAG